MARSTAPLLASLLLATAPVATSAVAAVALVVPGAGVAAAHAPASLAAQALLEMTPNQPGTWTAAAGVVQFNTMHRFRVLDPPSRKLVNTPTLLLGVGLADGLMAGVRYASSSLLVAGEPNEWEAYARWAPLAQDRFGVAAAVRAGWNATVGSADGALTLARDLGPVRLQASARGFSDWRGEDPAVAAAGGVVWRVHRWAALAADVARVFTDDEEPAWSAGLQLAIPYTPHTLSLHATNVNATTVQSASAGIPDRLLWGFEFTVPLTLSRYFGGRAESSGVAGDGQAAGPRSTGRSSGGAVTDTVVVSMDNRLRFLPDTVRVRVGQAVRWDNPSDIVHTVTADPELAADPANVALPDGAAPFDSGDLVPGAAFTHVFRVAGEYRYICLPHELAGMVGVVIVEDA